MNDELRKHIEQNRADFDIYETDLEASWTQIEKGLQPRKRLARYSVNVLKVAASVVILFAIGIAFYAGRQSMYRDANGIALHNVSPELAETELYYSALIEDKINYITGSDMEISDETWDQLQRLDEDYAELKQDLQDKADSEEVINAMIMYYRMKLQLLESIAGEIKERKQENEYEVNYSL